MLRRTQVILTDEATSAIDLKLDDQVRYGQEKKLFINPLLQIQQTIRQELGEATVVTIAHRLRTVIEYDKILVLGHGNILEFDTPAVLLQKPNGVFNGMCRGSADWDELKHLVRPQV